MVHPPDEKVGDCIIRIRSVGGVYRGVVIREGKITSTFEDDDEGRLCAQLRNEAGKLHPNYFGIDGAIARFIHFFPGGFKDRAFDLSERQYKQQARERLDGALSLPAAVDATAEDALAVRPAFNTNILSRFELARMHELLGSQDGAPFVRGAAIFALGDHAAGLSSMVAAIKPHGRHSWPMMTYLPNLWCPHEHMFLKPNATLDFAQRIGHRFQYDYSPDPDPAVYQSLLDLVSTTEAAISSLSPNDRIDVQSFIWVVGDYTDAELPGLQKLRGES